MRILFSSQPMYGHVNTVLPQALAAQQAGHEVVFATGAGLAAYVEGLGLDTWRVGPAQAPRGGAVDWVGFFVAAARERVDALLHLARRFRPDLVVHEETELAGAVVAAAVEATEVVHGLGLMPPVRMWEPLSAAIEELAVSRGVSVDQARLRAAPYVDVCPAALHSPAERIWTDLHPVRHSPGPLLPDERLPQELENLLYPQSVHLTLGTVFNDVGVIRTALEGLRDLPVNVVVTTGPGTDPAALGIQPPNVVVLPYLSHTLLLPRCDLVVSHVGAGVMLGALAQGVPQLALPQGVDQHMNAEALVRAGAGLLLDGVEVTPTSVEAAVRRLMGEPSFTESARAIRADLRAMPAPGEVIADLAAEASAPPTAGSLRARR